MWTQVASYPVLLTPAYAACITASDKHWGETASDKHWGETASDKRWGETASDKRWGEKAWVRG